MPPKKRSRVLQPKIAKNLKKHVSDDFLRLPSRTILAYMRQERMRQLSSVPNSAETSQTGDNKDPEAQFYYDCNPLISSGCDKQIEVFGGYSNPSPSSVMKNQFFLVGLNCPIVKVQEPAIIPSPIYSQAIGPLPFLRTTVPVGAFPQALAVLERLASE
jgi:hypothetical protein